MTVKKSNIQLIELRSRALASACLKTENINLWCLKDSMFRGVKFYKLFLNTANNLLEVFSRVGASFTLSDLQLRTDGIVCPKIEACEYSALIWKDLEYWPFNTN